MCKLMNSLGVVAVAGALTAIPVASARYQRANLRNIRVVAPGKLYRSGQLSLDGLERVVHDFGIRTVISLRDAENPGETPPDAAEEEYCRKHGIRHVRITPRSWWPEYGGPPPAEQGVARFLAEMDIPANGPVLLHCFRGTHRTGAMVAIYRMEYERWTNSEALAELRASGYTNLDRELDVLTYLENYRPRWLGTPADGASAR
jgi:tyrosine-protein phosphatase SIW14